MYRLSYYPWLTQNVPQPEINAQINSYARLVEAELKKLGQSDAKIEVLTPPLDVPEQIALVVGGGAELALMNPLGFVFARAKRPGLEALGVALREIDGKVGDTYFAQLYTRKDSGINKLEDARDRTVGYGHAYSTSNFLLPALMLRKAGVHPGYAFSRVEFLKGHEIVAKAVYEGKVDIGAGHDGVIVDLANQPGSADAKDVIVQLARSAPIPSDPIVGFIQDAAERQRVQQALVTAGNSPDGIKALEIFWGRTKGIKATTSAPYDVLTEALNALQLTQEDLIRRKT